MRAKEEHGAPPETNPTRYPSFRSSALKSQAPDAPAHTFQRKYTLYETNRPPKSLIIDFRHQFNNPCIRRALHDATPDSSHQLHNRPLCSGRSLVAPGWIRVAEVAGAGIAN